jgi:uncharacterized protein YjiS (DUF1127 family)
MFMSRLNLDYCMYNLPKPFDCINTMMRSLRRPWPRPVALAALWRVALAVLDRQRTRRAVLKLDDRLLRDAGLTRQEAERIAGGDTLLDRR